MEEPSVAVEVVHDHLYEDDHLQPISSLCPMWANVDDPNVMIRDHLPTVVTGLTFRIYLPRSDTKCDRCRIVSVRVACRRNGAMVVMVPRVGRHQNLEESVVRVSPNVIVEQANIDLSYPMQHGMTYVVSN